MAEFLEHDAHPVARRGLNTALHDAAVVVRIVLRIPVRFETGSGRVVGQRSQYDRRTGLANYLDDAADAVVDFVRRTQGADPRVGTVELHDQTLGRAAFEPQAAERVEVGHDNRVANHDVDDARVVPDALRGECLTANHHPVDRIGLTGAQLFLAADPVVGNQRTLVIAEPVQHIDPASRPARVALQDVVQRVGVDADRRCVVVANGVADDDRLRAANEDHGFLVEAAAKSALRPLTAHAIRIELEQRVGDPRLGLVNLDDVEGAKRPFHASHAAAKGERGVVDAAACVRSEKYAAPVAGQGVGIGAAGRVERAARAESTVDQRREYDLQAVGTLGDQLPADRRLDPRPVQFDDGRRVDPQPAVGRGTASGTGLHQQAAAGHAVVGVGSVAAVELRDQFKIDRTGHASIEVPGHKVLGGARQLAEHHRAVSNRHGSRDRVRGGSLVAEIVHVDQHVLVSLAFNQRTAGNRIQRDEHDGRSEVFLQQAARLSLDFQVLAEHVYDVRVVEPPRHGQLADVVARRRFDADEQAVDRVSAIGIGRVDQRIAEDVGTDASVVGRVRDPLMPRGEEIRFLEAVRRGRHGRVGAPRDRVKRNGWTSAIHLNRRHDLRHRVDDYDAAPIAKVGVVDVVEEYPLFVVHEVTVRAIHVVSEQQAAPVAAGRLRLETECIKPNLLVVVRCEEYGSRNDLALLVHHQIARGRDQVRRTVNLQRAAAAIDAGSRTADPDASTAKLNDRPGVEHQRDAVGNIQLVSVRQRSAQAVETDLVGQVVVQRALIFVPARIADHAQHVVGMRERHGRAQVVDRLLARAVTLVGRRLIDEHDAAQHANALAVAGQRYLTVAGEHDAGVADIELPVGPGRFHALTILSEEPVIAALQRHAAAIGGRRHVESGDRIDGVGEHLSQFVAARGHVVLDHRRIDRLGIVVVEREYDRRARRAVDRDRRAVVERVTIDDEVQRLLHFSRHVDRVVVDRLGKPAGDIVVGVAGTKLNRRSEEKAVVVELEPLLKTKAVANRDRLAVVVQLAVAEQFQTPLGGNRVEPEVVHATRRAVRVPIDGRGTRHFGDQRIVGVVQIYNRLGRFGTEGEPQVVNALRRTAETRVFDHRIEAVVSGRRDRQEVVARNELAVAQFGFRFEQQFDGRIGAQVVVVA